MLMCIVGNIWKKEFRS